MIEVPTRGLIAATFTPMNDSGTITLDPIESYAEHLSATGIEAVMVGGTTGEFPSLSTEERIATTRRWRQVVGSEFALIAHASHTCLEKAVEMAKAYSQMQVDAVAVAAPYFFTPASASQFIAFLKPIVEALGEVPLYYYYIPSMIQSPMTLVQFLDEACDALPELKGVKYTHYDAEELGRLIRRYDGRYDFAFGRDENFLDGLKAGANIAIGSTYNFFTSEFGAVREAYEAGNIALASTLQAGLTESIDAIIEMSPNPMSGLKYMMKTVGIDCGPVRLPLAAITPKAGDALVEKIAEILARSKKCVVGADVVA